MNIKLVITYFGASYAGWQKTIMGPSIESTLEEALAKILQHPVKLQAASRTDAGVHARGQVVNFFTQKQIPLNRLMTSLNGVLPKEIAVLSIEEMSDSFHPTIDSIKKEYWYEICNSRVQLPFHRHTSWHFFYPLNIEAMRKAATLLIGIHDFSAFCNELNDRDRDPICHLEKIEIIKVSSERIRITLCGNRFLYKMARNIAGTLAYVGSSKLTEDACAGILKCKDRTLAGVTAPAHGLTLNHVFY